MALPPTLTVMPLANSDAIMPAPMPLFANMVICVTGLPVVAVIIPMGITPPDPIMAVTEFAVQVPPGCSVAFTVMIWPLLIMPMLDIICPFIPWYCVLLPVATDIGMPCSVPMVKVPPDMPVTLPTTCIIPPCSGVALAFPVAVSADASNAGVKVIAPPEPVPTEVARFRSRFITMALLPTVSGLLNGILTVIGLEKTCCAGLCDDVMEVTVAEDNVTDIALYVPWGMDCIISGATVPRRCASSIVIGEEIVKGTLVPDVLVKLMALTVTAHSRTESEGVSPMFTSTAVDAAEGVVGEVVPVLELEPLPHPIVPAVANARVSNVQPAHFAIADRFMVLLPARLWRMLGHEKSTFANSLLRPHK